MCAASSEQGSHSRGWRRPLKRPAFRVSSVGLACGVAIAGLLAWYVVVGVARPSFVGDEFHHVPAIRGLTEGDWGPARALPMPPTYHALAALLARVLGTELWAVRLFNVLLGVAAIGFMAAALRARYPDAGAWHLLRLAWNPLLLPFWVFAYTDLAALLGVIIALNSYVRRQYVAAAGGLLLACLFRQSSVVWVAFFIALGAVELWQRQPGEPVRWTFVRRAARVLWPYVLVLILGGGILVAWREIALPSNIENRVRPNIAQFYILALTAGLLWAPVWLAHLVEYWPQRFAAWLARPWICAALVAAVGVLGLVFQNPHGWNADPNYLRNWPLVAMSRSLAARFLLSTCIVVFIVVFSHATWHSAARRTLGLVWAFALLFLVPHYLVDPRYYIVPLVLVDFFTPYTPVQARRLAVWYLLLTLAVGVFIVSRPGGLIGIW